MSLCGDFVECRNLGGGLPGRLLDDGGNATFQNASAGIRVLIVAQRQDSQIEVLGAQQFVQAAQLCVHIRDGVDVCINIADNQAFHVRG